MGVNLALLVSRADSTASLVPSPAERPQSRSVLERLYPRREFHARDEVSLTNTGLPERGAAFVGLSPGIQVIASRDFMLFNPRKLKRTFVTRSAGDVVCLLFSRSAFDVFAFGVWAGGELVRSLSINPVGGVVESIGTELPLEQPFWAGDRRPPADYALPFHPLDLAEELYREFLGLVFEGIPSAGQPSPDDIWLAGFDIVKTNRASPPVDQSWRRAVTDRRRTNQRELTAALAELGYVKASRSAHSFQHPAHPEVRFVVGPTHVRCEKRISGAWRLWESYLLTSETDAARQVAANPELRLTNRR